MYFGTFRVCSICLAVKVHVLMFVLIIFAICILVGDKREMEEEEARFLHDFPAEDGFLSDHDKLEHHDSGECY